MNFCIELECIRVFFLKAYSYSKDSGLRIFFFLSMKYYYLKTHYFHLKLSAFIFMIPQA